MQIFCSNTTLDILHIATLPYSSILLYLFIPVSSSSLGNIAMEL